MCEPAAGAGLRTAEIAELQACGVARTYGGDANSAMVAVDGDELELVGMDRKWRSRPGADNVDRQLFGGFG